MCMEFNFQEILSLIHYKRIKMRSHVSFFLIFFKYWRTQKKRTLNNSVKLVSGVKKQLTYEDVTCQPMGL